MTKIGTRYSCQVCGTAVLCLRPSPNDYVCCEVTMGQMQMEELPSGD